MAKKIEVDLGWAKIVLNGDSFDVLVNYANGEAAKAKAKGFESGEVRDSFEAGAIRISKP